MALEMMHLATAELKASGIERCALKDEDLEHPTMAEGLGSLFSNVLPWSV